MFGSAAAASAGSPAAAVWLQYRLHSRKSAALILISLTRPPHSPPALAALQRCRMAEV
jgi:hypothetical protein